MSEQRIPHCDRRAICCAAGAWLAFIPMFGLPASAGAGTPMRAWVATYKATHSGDEVVDMAVDGAGNIYVTGKSNFGFATIKYNSSGKKQWVRTYNLGGNDDYPTALCIDSTGSALVTGSSSGGSTAYDFATLKYGPSGKRTWLVRYNNAENNSDFANAVTVDGDGNVYVTGGSRSDETDYDYTTIKYDSAGAQQWRAVYVGEGILPGESYDDSGLRVALDPLGNVYVTGTSKRGSFDIVTVKYDPAGQQQWAVRYDGPDHLIDRPEALAVDGAGSVYVAGSSESKKSGQDIVTIKYDTGGTARWIKRHTGPGSYPDDVQDLAVDQSGNVYITGSTNVSGNSNFLTLKYSAAGARQWVATYDYGKYPDGAWALDLDAAGNVYVTGEGLSATLSDDLITMKYDARGKRQWVVVYEDVDRGRDIEVDDSGNIVVTGQNFRTGWITIKYVEAASGLLP